MKTKRNALTLVELLIVIVIVGIQAAIVAIGTPKLRKSANTHGANITFNNINKVGLEKAEELYAGNNIEYGIKHKLFTQEQVDAEQKKYEIGQAWSTLDKVSSEGLENTREEEREVLKYAIEKGWFTKEKIEAEQKKYETDRTFRIKIYLKQIDPNHLSIEPPTN